MCDRHLPHPMWQPELLEVQKPPRKNDVRLFYHDMVGDEGGGGSLISTMVSFKQVTDMGPCYTNNFHCQKRERGKIIIIMRMIKVI